MATTLPASWTTPRLRLRQFASGDVQDVLAYATDQEWGRFLPVPDPYEQSDAEAFIAAQLKADHETAPRWALEVDGAVVGSVELALDHDAGTATLHYSIARRLWGQGLMTEAVASVVRCVFEELPHIQRISSWADVRNVASWRVMEKVGLARQSVKPEAREIKGERVDDYVYAVERDGSPTVEKAR